MGLIIPEMEPLRISGYIDRAAEDFLRQWQSDSCYIEAHTSGSTGAPKRIMLAKNDMLKSAENTVRFFGLNSDSLLLLPLSVSYIAGKMMIVRAIVSGAELLTVKPSNNPMEGLTIDQDISLMAIVPSQIEAVLPYADRIRRLIIGGAPMTPQQELAVTASGIEAYATYGMTETCSHVAMRRIGESCFHALDGVTFSCDSRGCLVINASEFTYKSLVTNDIVELVDCRTFRWLGRYDNVINSGGIKIFPEIIEAEIAPLLCDRRFYITSRKSGKWGEEAVLMVEGEEIAGLAERIASVLDPVRRPKAIVYQERFDMTSSGKIKRNKL